MTFHFPPESGQCDDGAALELLSEGSLKIEGRLVAASNATMYCTVRRRGQTAACVYKPVAGERPLWDFPLGTLAGREVAAYAVSEAAGWN
ncbi:MAG TPA: phosphatidylinositol kinase, partial [Streptosporangiaceae bacterium]